MFLKFLNKEACLDGESAGWEKKSALLWHKLSSYPVNYIRGSCSLCFSLEMTIVLGLITTCSLPFYPIYLHYLGNDAGVGRSVSDSHSFCWLALAGCSEVTPEGPCLCRANSTALASTVVRVFVCRDSTL